MRGGPSIKGEHSQAIGRWRGGRTTKIHALTDRFCRPVAFVLTCGQAADCTAGALLLEGLPTCRIVLADKSYDSDAIRRQIEAAWAASNIPPKINHRRKPCFVSDVPAPSSARRPTGQFDDQYERIILRLDSTLDSVREVRLSGRGV